MRVKARKQLYENVLLFPAEKDAAGTINLVSAEFNPFEHTSPGALNYQLVAADDSKITDNVVLSLEVSYDGGTTWVVVNGSITTLDNGSGAPVSAYTADALVVAPRVRVKAELDNSSRLAAGHGCSVNLELEENSDFYRAQVVANAITLAATLADNSTNGKTVRANGMAEKVVVVHSGDSSKMTNITWKLQSSFDGEYWWDVNTPVNISALNFSETVLSTKLGGFFRVVVIAGNTGLATGHGLKFGMAVLHN